MANTLIISGHPDYKNSVANRAILDDAHRQLPHAEIVYLDALYPDYKIDVKREQNRLAEPVCLVFEFPFWWYGSPSLMHSYVEQVFTHGFAYGSRGLALHGKRFILSYTTGAAEEDYSESGHQGYAMSAFLPPFMAMAKLTGLDFRGSVVSYGMALPDRENKEAKDKIIQKAADHAKRLIALIQA